jgi:hypothetical protein
MQEAKLSTLKRMFDQPFAEPEGVSVGAAVRPDRLSGFIRQWQVKYNLTGGWLHRAALATIQAHASGDLGSGLVLLELENRPDMYEGRTPVPPPRPPSGNPSKDLLHALDRIVMFPAGPEEVCLDDLYGRERMMARARGGVARQEWEDSRRVVLGEFDPRAETMDAAVERIMPRLETLLRGALDLIVEADQKVLDARPVRIYRRIDEHMAWLVRYQVFGTHPTRFDHNYSRAMRTLRELAYAIGIEPRPPAPRGRRRAK